MTRKEQLLEIIRERLREITRTEHAILDVLAEAALNACVFLRGEGIDCDEKKLFNVIMESKKVYNPAIGTAFDEFLKESGIYEQCNAEAVEKVESWRKEGNK